MQLQHFPRRTIADKQYVLKVQFNSIWTQIKNQKQLACLLTGVACKASEQQIPVEGRGLRVRTACC